MLIVLQGLAIHIPPEDYFRERLTEVRHIGLQWADTAKKVYYTATLPYHGMHLFFCICITILIVFLSAGLNGWRSTGT